MKSLRLCEGGFASWLGRSAVPAGVKFGMSENACGYADWRGSAGNHGREREFATIATDFHVPNAVG